MPKPALGSSGKESSPTGRAHTRGDIAACAAHSTGGQRIDVRGRDVDATLATQVGVAHVVGHDDHYIGLGIGLGGDDDSKSAGYKTEPAEKQLVAEFCRHNRVPILICASEIGHYLRGGYIRPMVTCGPLRDIYNPFHWRKWTEGVRINETGHWVTGSLGHRLGSWKMPCLPQVALSAASHGLLLAMVEGRLRMGKMRV